MPSTILYKPGDILLIAFPFTDFTTLKQRPCIVISAKTFNKTHPDIIVAAITSKIDHPTSPDEYKLSEKEQLACQLPLPSLVKCGKIVTIDQRLVRKQLGALPPSGMKNVRAKIKKIIL